MRLLYAQRDGHVAVLEVAYAYTQYYEHYDDENDKRCNIAFAYFCGEYLLEREERPIIEVVVACSNLSEATHMIKELYRNDSLDITMHSEQTAVNPNVRMLADIYVKEYRKVVSI